MLFVDSFLVRSSVVGGSVWYTRWLGAWDGSVQTEALYNNSKDKARPHIQQLEKKLPFEIPALPQQGEIRFLGIYYYNEAVKGAFHHFEMLPCYAGQLAMKAKKSMEQFAQAPPTAKD